MNRNNIFQNVLLLTITMLSYNCSDNLQYTENFMPINLSASYPASSRASDAGFEGGDRMGLYVLDYINGCVQDISSNNANASNVRFEFNGTNNSWFGIHEVYWSGRDIPSDIIAYYPYSANIPDPKEMTFSVSRHQESVATESTMGGYESSDLLWGAKIKQMPTSGKVDLTMNHILAGVRIALKEGTGFSSGEWTGLKKSVVLPSTVTSGTVNLRDGSVKIGDNNPETIVPMEYNGDFRCVVFPQNVAANSPLVSITIGSTGYNLVKQEETSLISGKMHNITITVDKKSDGDYEFLVYDESVTQWIDDVEFRDGVIRSYTKIHVGERGALKEYLLKEGINYKQLTNLKLTGEIDENDWYFMRDEMTSLKALNLKEAKTFGNDRPDVIPERAMYCKSTLSRIVFPDNLKIIGSSAFHRSGLMGDLIIPEGVKKIGEGFGDESFYIGSQDNGLYGAFSYCQNLLGKLSLPSTLTHIEHGAFTYDEFEGNLSLPSSLEFIGNYSFYKNNFTGNLVLPESLTYIGDGAFGRTQFSGSLEIPKNISIIRQNTFDNVSFSGSLILSNGIVEIQKYAFDGCGFRGELLLPPSLRSLGNYAFHNTKISNIVFPENLTSIGKGCFMNCINLNEKIIIPANVTRINEYTFAGDILLSEIELHENMTFVGAAAFANDVNLKEITVLNPEPPLISLITEGNWWENKETELGPFYGIPISNVTLKVPEGSRDTYTRADGWKDIGRHATINGFGCRPERVCALNNSHEETVIVDAENEWEISHIPSWCKTSASSGYGKTQLTVTISDLPSGEGDREDYIEFNLKGTDYTARCELRQFDYRYKEDECITFQKASKGSGIDILFVGDSFDAESIKNGEFLDLVNEQLSAFFSIEPYATYRDRFNVYACVSLSQETGVNTTNTSKRTKFRTRFDNGTGCSVKGLACNDPDEVFDYAVAHSPLTKEKMHKSLIIIVLNSDQYGSVSSISESGSAIAIVGKSNDTYPMDTRGMLQHEACGHAFGKLAEERIIVNRYAKDFEKIEIRELQSRGWYQNISLTGKLGEVNWSDLIFDTRYSDKVDVFEGGYGVTRGVFRAEINSCMNYGIPYFSAAARLDIMRRILEYSGEGFTMEKFHATDSDKWGETSTTRAAIPEAADAYIHSGIHNHVRIIKSNKY